MPPKHVMPCGNLDRTGCKRKVMSSATCRCAVFYSFGTVVEVAEMSGQLAAEEMVSFCSSLAPVSMAAVHMVENTSLAALSYFNRYCSSSRCGYSQFIERQFASALFRVRWPTPLSGAARWTDDLTVAEKWFGWPPGGGAFGRGTRVLQQLKVAKTSSIEVDCHRAHACHVRPCDTWRVAGSQLESGQRPRCGARE